MIDEKKLLEFIEDLPEYGSPDCTFVDASAIYDFIEQQPKFGEWIPCSEQLPVSDEWQIIGCIATVKRGETRTVESVAYDCSNRKWFVNKGAEILAWQPLPESYEEDH